MGVAVPIGCLVQALAVVFLVGAIIIADSYSGSYLHATAGRVTARVIDDGARGGPAVLPMVVVPLR